MNPQMLTLLRESRGLSGSQLASLSGVPQPTLSKMENGLAPLDDARMERIAAALDYPLEAFTWSDTVYGFGSAAFFHRKQQSLGQGALRKIHALMNLLRMRVTRLMRSVEVDAKFTIPSIDVEELGSPAEVARAVRAQWLVPLGPVKSMTAVLERAGAVVVRADLESPRISALSTMTPDGPPLLILNTGQPADRERFTLAHELGHLVMHATAFSVAEADVEAEADAFASEFLMPAAEIRPQLRGMDLGRAAQLKVAWRVSMASLVRRARDLGVIDESRYRSLVVQMSRKGWRKAEPVQIPADEPTVLADLIAVHLHDHEYTAHELGLAVGLHEHEFRSVMPVPTGAGERPRRHLRAL